MPQSQTVFLYNELITSAKNPDETIAFCTSKLIVLNNLPASQSLDELQSYIGIYYWLTSAYSSKQQYKNILKIAEPVLYKIKNAAANLNYNLMPDVGYRNLLFNNIVARYYILKDYKIAIITLKRLVEADPQNDLYKVWLKASVLRIRIRLLNYITYSLLALFILGFAFSRMLPRQLTYVLTHILPFGGLICVAFELYFRSTANKKF